MPSQRILVKKYENRRLYDATNSRYVNLDEVAQFVQQGCEVQVIDAASGEDITRVILTQIIAEGARAPESNFPLDILRQMIIASGRASQESAMRYTKAMLDLYQSTYRAMVPALNPFDFLQNAAPQQSSEAGAAGSAPTAASDDLSQLKQRISELERAISGMGARPSPAPRGKPAKKAARKKR